MTCRGVDDQAGSAVGLALHGGCDHIHPVVQGPGTHREFPFVNRAQPGRGQKNQFGPGQGQASGAFRKPHIVADRGPDAQAGEQGDGEIGTRSGPGLFTVPEMHLAVAELFPAGGIEQQQGIVTVTGGGIEFGTSRGDGDAAFPGDGRPTDPPRDRGWGQPGE